MIDTLVENLFMVEIAAVVRCIVIVCRDQVISSCFTATYDNDALYLSKSPDFILMGTTEIAYYPINNSSKLFFFIPNVMIIHYIQCKTEWKESHVAYHKIFLRM